MNTQPKLPSRKSTFNQDDNSWTSQILLENSSRVHARPVLAQFCSTNVQRLLRCGHLKSTYSSPVDTTAIVSATEVDHNERATEADLSTGNVTIQRINTGSGDQSMLPNTDSNSDATTSLQEVISKITLLPVAFDRVPSLTLASSDKSHLGYSSESYAAPLDLSTSQDHPKGATRTETGNGKLQQKGTTNHFGTERSAVAGGITDITRHSSSEVPTHGIETLSRALTEMTSSQTRSQIIRPTSATKVSTHEWQDTAISGSNISAELSKQGVLLVLSTVLGGVLALVGILNTSLILLHFNRHARGSVTVRSQPGANFSGKEERKLSRTVEFSHFSIDT
ncbi:hypothetical protein N7475_000314 [Penicillium sp. IBT 31633x]|nr:hypothetical protein N7475_000314 [Penicillium sp. IBT 31633x]